MQEIGFFCNDTATTEIYTLSLHDALPISTMAAFGRRLPETPVVVMLVLGLSLSALALGSLLLQVLPGRFGEDRKSTRLNSKSRQYLVCRLLLEKKKHITATHPKLSLSASG